MLSDLLDDIKDELTDSALFKQVDSYEGQFDDLDNYVLKPPSALVEIDSGSEDVSYDNYDEINIAVYLTTSRISDKTGSSMLGLIDSTRAALHDLNLSSGRVEFQNFRKMLIFKGFNVYLMNFKLRR